MRGKAKNLAVQTAPKNPKRIRTSQSHIGGWSKLSAPRVGGGKRGSKRIAKKLRKA